LQTKLRIISHYSQAAQGNRTLNTNDLAGPQRSGVSPTRHNARLLIPWERLRPPSPKRDRDLRRRVLLAGIAAFDPNPNWCSPQKWPALPFGPSGPLLERFGCSQRGLVRSQQQRLLNKSCHRGSRGLLLAGPPEAIAQIEHGLTNLAEFAQLGDWFVATSYSGRTHCARNILSDYPSNQSEGVGT